MKGNLIQCIHTSKNGGYKRYKLYRALSDLLKGSRKQKVTIENDRGEEVDVNAGRFNLVIDKPKGFDALSDVNKLQVAYQINEQRIREEEAAEERDEKRIKSLKFQLEMTTEAIRKEVA